MVSDQVANYGDLFINIRVCIYSFNIFIIMSYWQNEEKIVSDYLGVFSRRC